MLGFDSLTSVAKGYLLGNISLHTVPPISGHEIMVHLILSWMNGKSRLVSLTKYLIVQLWTLGTQILPLHHNTHSSSSEKLGDFSSLMLRFISLIFSSVSWPLWISWIRLEPTSISMASAFATIGWSCQTPHTTQIACYPPLTDSHETFNLKCQPPH
jgi:hypothetical protein